MRFRSCECDGSNVWAVCLFVSSFAFVCAQFAAVEKHASKLATIASVANMCALALCCAVLFLLVYSVTVPLLQVRSMERCRMSAASDLIGGNVSFKYTRVHATYHRLQ